MKLYTKSEFAALVCRDERTIERWIKHRKIVPGRLPSGAPVFSDKHIEEIMAGVHKPAAAKPTTLDATAWFAAKERRRKRS